MITLMPACTGVASKRESKITEPIVFMRISWPRSDMVDGIIECQMILVHERNKYPL